MNIPMHRLHPSSPKRIMRLSTMMIMSTRTISTITVTYTLIEHTLILRLHNPTLTHIQMYTHTHIRTREIPSPILIRTRICTPLRLRSKHLLRGETFTPQPLTITPILNLPHGLTLILLITSADGNHSHSHPSTHTYQTTSDGLTAEHPHSRSTSPSRKRTVNNPPLTIAPPEEEDICHLHSPVLSRVRGSPDQDSIPSPVTPNHQFGHDDHYDKFHSSQRRKAPICMAILMPTIRAKAIATICGERSFTSWL